MKLHKLMYYCYGQCLVKNNNQLTDESFGAWKYGCVLPSVYSYFNSYGSATISSYGFDHKGERLIFSKDSDLFVTMIDTTRDLVHLKDFALSRRNHHKNGAWYKTRKAKGDRALIDINLIREEFGLTEELN